MNKTIYALGFFDGVHIGHAALLAQCRCLARENGCRAGVVTFAAHPDTLVLGNTPPLINTPQDREKLLRERFSMDCVVTLPFDDNMHIMLWQNFLDMLIREYAAAGFVCGEDFRFGYRGEGSADSLVQFCETRKLACAVVSDQTIDGIRVSSTYIRSQIETGDMETAVKFLGHPHILTGSVIHGHQLGRRLGIPTANLRLPEGLAEPKFGVYACRAIVEGRIYPAVTNIGTRPTVEGRNVTVEPWILDYQGNLYGQEITLEFYRFLRPERKFPTLDALKEEIHRNAEQTRQFFAFK
ncbi:MAG: bifunctional riboflavin kinase/FAD synthetase [Faecousia sp.]